MNSHENVISFIKKSPKSELHLHIEGSLEPELMFKLSKRNKIEIPFKSVDEIRSAYNFSNLDSFLKIYYQGSNVLITEEDFFDLTWEYILRCKKDNIVPFYMGEEIFNKYGGVKSNYFNDNDDHMMEFNKNLIQSIDNFIKSLN